MDYYSRIIEATRYVDEEILKGTFKEEIIYKVRRKFGMSSKWINNLFEEKKQWLETTNLPKPELKPVEEKDVLKDFMKKMKPFVIKKKKVKKVENNKNKTTV